MTEIAKNLSNIHSKIIDAAERYGRDPTTISLLAVSKTQDVAKIKQANASGQKSFGENYLQEAISKVEQTGELSLDWHFIGQIQSRKCQQIAQNFAWVHSVDRLKVAKKLNSERQGNKLNICIQVKLDAEDTKGGVSLSELPEIAAAISQLPQLKLRGLMAIPAPCSEFSEQRQQFARLRQALEDLNQQGYALDTLSMGMSNDYEAAIAEGATIIRIGTAIFGRRT